MKLTSHFPCDTLYTRTDNYCDCVVVKSCHNRRVNNTNKQTHKYTLYISDQTRRECVAVKAATPVVFKSLRVFSTTKAEAQAIVANFIFSQNLCIVKSSSDLHICWVTMDSNISKLTRSKHKKTKHKQTPQHDDHCANHNVLVIINTTRLFEAVVVTSTHPYQATTCL